MHNNIKKCIAAALIAAVTVCFSLCGCSLYDLLESSSASETYAGALSDSVYSTKLSAIKNYVTNEFGGSTGVTYLSYTQGGTLSSSEISDLGITAFTTSYVSVEEEKVTYSYSGSSDQLTSRMYVVETSEGYQYFSPALSSGENITNSYLQSVLSADNYLNCTVNVTMNGFLDGINIAAYTQLMEFDYDKGHIDQKITGLNLEVYFKEQGGKLNFYTNSVYDSNGDLVEVADDFHYISPIYFIKGGYSVSSTSMSGIEDVVSFIFSVNADASYFVKTDNGFSMPDDKYKELVCALLGDELYEEFLTFSENYKFKMCADYTVSGGVLSKSEQVITFITEEKQSFYFKNVTMFSEFGTTEVTLPDITG